MIGVPRVVPKGTDRLPTVDKDVLKLMKDPSHRYNTESYAMTVEERESIRETTKNNYRPTEPPAWLKHDKHVLRYFAYFQETVTESAHENYRVRHAIIYYYMEDGTMMIAEPKVENSGIPQGAFLKRHRFPKPANEGGGEYHFFDIRCGTTISIYSRAFRIVDCDEFTRDFYKTALGMDFGMPEACPVDSWGKTQQGKAERKGYSRDMISDLEFRKVALGGSRSNTKLEQFMENDRKVLRFKLYWDDPTLYGARQYFCLLFYLADNSVEIISEYARNSGRDKFPGFWTRAPLPKNPMTSAAPCMLEPDTVIFLPEDLIIGKSIKVYNRQMVLYNCDEFTRDFYKKFIGWEQPVIEIPNPPPVHAKLNYPPHTGIGTEEDSLENCIRLVPKVRKIDVKKMITEVGLQLRYEAVMVNGMAEDENRRFVIVIFIADEHVGVWELPTRNSGHFEGKFSEKKRTRNPETDKWFKPEDFFLGAVVTINSSPFLLTKADEGALRYMEAHPERFPFADINAVLGKLTPLRDELASSEMMAAEEIQEIARSRYGVDLSEHELVTLLRKLGEEEQAGMIRTEKLLGALG